LTSPSLVILLTKTALVADMVSIVAFVLDYSRLAPWWRNPVGRTIVIKDLFLLGVVSLVVASVFFQFSRFTSEVAAWAQVALLGGMALAMCWRIWVFERIHRHRPPKDRHEDNQGGSL
jgi:hypothetical protein